VQRFLEVFHADYGEHRAEDFFLGNRRIGRDMIENRRRYEVAAIVAAAAQALASEQ